MNEIMSCDVRDGNVWIIYRSRDEYGDSAYDAEIWRDGKPVCESANYQPTYEEALNDLTNIFNNLPTERAT